MKPKILLIKAKCNNFFGEAQPPLGLLYISASLKKEGYSEIALFEAEKYSERYKEKLKEILDIHNPDIVGISAITAESVSAHKMAEIIKNFNPKITVIIGGPYPSHYPEYATKDKNIDFTVIGEGEKTVVEILKHIENGREKINEIRGIAYKKNDSIITNPPAILIDNLDEIPIPDWGLIDFESYSNFIPQSPFLYGKKYAVILTSRGCPWHCTYCHNIFGKKFRAHSPQRVIKEMEILYKEYGVENIEITDDIFNLDLERAKKILKEKSQRLPDVKLFFVNG
ncbi:MAG TPA: radical SAM protein, partial [Elusimicrobiales bacterium]|nr:radical SAM protein [Elusimicrobiales bacterium]